jgi:hypothetical protein
MEQSAQNQNCEFAQLVDSKAEQVKCGNGQFSRNPWIWIK